MLAAQDLEQEILVLRNQGEAISIPLEKTRARRQAMRRDFQALKNKLERTRIDQRQQEKNLAELEAKLEAAQGRQSVVKNPKQAEALELEIERAAAAASTAEEETLQLMEQEETLVKRLATEEGRLERDMQVITPELERLGKLLEENQSMAQALREERIAAINRMDEETRENYEWLVNKHGMGQAVSRVSGAACGGCGSMLLPDQNMKIRDQENLHRCTHCYRFLIAD